MKYLFLLGWLICAVSLHEVANFSFIQNTPPTASKIGVSVADSTLKILTPAKGEVLRLSSEYKITWESKVSGNVQIDLYKTDKLDRTLEFAALNVVGATNSYTWKIPADIPLGEDYQIVIYDIKNKEFTAKSEIFPIQKSKKLPKWVIIAGSVGFVAIVGLVIILTRPKARRLPDPPSPEGG